MLKSFWPKIYFKLQHHLNTIATTTTKITENFGVCCVFACECECECEHTYLTRICTVISSMEQDCVLFFRRKGPKQGFRQGTALQRVTISSCYQGLYDSRRRFHERSVPFFTI